MAIQTIFNTLRALVIAVHEAIANRLTTRRRAKLQRDPLDAILQHYVWTIVIQLTAVSTVIQLFIWIGERKELAVIVSLILVLWGLLISSAIGDTKWRTGDGILMFGYFAKLRQLLKDRETRQSDLDDFGTLMKNRLFHSNKLHGLETLGTAAIQIIAYWHLYHLIGDFTLRRGLAGYDRVRIGSGVRGLRLHRAGADALRDHYRVHTRGNSLRDVRDPRPVRSDVGLENIPSAGGFRRTPLSLHRRTTMRHTALWYQQFFDPYTIILMVLAVQVTALIIIYLGIEHRTKYYGAALLCALGIRIAADTLVTLIT
jgi:hypothetical protein